MNNLGYSNKNECVLKKANTSYWWQHRCVMCVCTYSTDKALRVPIGIQSFNPLVSRLNRERTSSAFSLEESRPICIQNKQKSSKIALANYETTHHSYCQIPRNKSLALRTHVYVEAYYSALTIHTVRHSFLHVECTTAYRCSTLIAHKACRVPGLLQSINSILK